MITYYNKEKVIINSYKYLGSTNCVCTDYNIFDVNYPMDIHDCDNKSGYALQKMNGEGIYLVHESMNELDIKDCKCFYQAQVFCQEA